MSVVSATSFRTTKFGTVTHGEERVIGGQPHHCICTNESCGSSATDEFLVSIFRLDTLALSVIATGTWLAGWLAGWVSVTAGIVSKRLNLFENF